MRLFLGVDGGQSGTTALAGDETGRVVRIAKSGPTNRVSRAEFLAAIRAAAGDDDYEAACFGFSGGSEDKEAMTREVVRAAKFVFAHDALIALEGATAGEPGVITIAGTGSIAFGRNAEGRTARAGGWGFAISDEGSGHWIGRKAISAVLQARDEDEAAARNLAEAILRTWQLKDLDELIRIANSTAADFP